LLGEDPNAPVDLTALIANRQAALDAVLVAVLAAPSEEPHERICVSQTRHPCILVCQVDDTVRVHDALRMPLTRLAFNQPINWRVWMAFR
jgi:hypothetical protein